MEEAFYNISMYLYNKNGLESAQMAPSGLKSLIRIIEGSSKYIYFYHEFAVIAKSSNVLLFSISTYTYSTYKVKATVAFPIDISVVANVLQWDY